MPLDESRCDESGWATALCSVDPVGHPARRIAMGCGRYACPDPICRRKHGRRRLRQAYDDHFAALDLYAARKLRGPVPLLRWGLTVPPELRPLVTPDDVSALRRAGREAVESWMRRWLGLGDAKPAILAVFQPAGDDLATWHPHLHLAAPAVGVRDPEDGPLEVRRLTLDLLQTPAAHADLARRWADALADLTGQAVQGERVTRGVHVADPETGRNAKRAILADYVRGFPGWELPRGAKMLTWSGAFSTRLWASTRDRLLGEQSDTDEPFVCAECSAPMRTFPNLDRRLRHRVLDAEEDTGQPVVTDVERTWGWHDRKHYERWRRRHLADRGDDDGPSRCGCSVCAVVRQWRAASDGGYSAQRRAAQRRLRYLLVLRQDRPEAFADGGPLGPAALARMGQESGLGDGLGLRSLDAAAASLLAAAHARGVDRDEWHPALLPMRCDLEHWIEAADAAGLVPDGADLADSVPTRLRAAYAPRYAPGSTADDFCTTIRLAPDVRAARPWVDRPPA